MKSKIPLIKVPSHKIWIQVIGVIIALLCGINSQCLYAQNIRYVKPIAVGAGDGTSWGNASADLQAMISTAGTEQVWVAGGLYKPGGSNNTDRTVSVSIPNGIQIYGGFIGNEKILEERPLAQPSSTTLSGDIGLIGNSADNSYHVVTMGPYYDVDKKVRLDGFVITEGQANGPQDQPSSLGGGLYAQFVNSPIIINCYFTKNSALLEGGGLYAYTDHIQLINCSFSNNYSGTNGGGLSTDTSLPIINCSFFNNTARSQGGGAMAYSASLPWVNCSFANNIAPMSGALYSGSSQTMTNCIFWNNGRFNSFWTLPAMYYCLLENSGNGYSEGEGIILTSISPFVSNTDFRLNACSQAINAGRNITYIPQVDGLGNSRIVGNRIDIGAYEFQGTPLDKMYTIKPGMWNDPTIWSCGRIPLLSDPVQIKHLTNRAKEL